MEENTRVNKRIKMRESLKRKILLAIMVILCVVLAYSLVRIIQVSMEYRAGEALYEQGRQEFVKELTTAPPPMTVPSSAPVVTVPVPGTAPSVAPDPSNPPPSVTEVPEVPEVPEIPGPGIEVDMAGLEKVNPDIFGWILIKDTVISFPLLEGVDNEKYLTTTYDGKESRFGSIFMDKSNSVDLSDDHTIIYGHNIKKGFMFGSLSSFGKQDYYEKHPYIYIITAEGYLKYKIFSAHTTLTTSGVFTRKFNSSGEFNDFINLISRASWLKSDISPTTKNKILTLSTCTSPNQPDERFVVHAVLVDDTRVK